MPRSPVVCQSPASRPPVVRQSIACSASRQPHTSHSPATRLLLACCSADPDQLSFAPPPRHADECSAPSSTHQASIRFACRWLSRTPAARLPLARLPLACHSPVARQCWMSGAPPAAHQPSASWPAHWWPLSSCAPAARQSLACLSASRSGGSSVPVLPHFCWPGEALSPLSALAVAWMPGSIPGWSPGLPCLQVPGLCRYSLALCICFVRRVCE